METSTKQLTQQNAIAYNRKLRGQLKQLHEMLGDEITDLAAGAFGSHDTYFAESQKTLKHLSELTAQLSVFLLEAKNSKKKLSEEEKRDHDMIEDLVSTLGNLQYELNKLMKHMQSSDNIEMYTKESLQVMEQITLAQEKFRAVRMQINDYGSMSNNPDIAYLFDDDDWEE